MELSGLPGDREQRLETGMEQPPAQRQGPETLPPQWPSQLPPAQGAAGSQVLLRQMGPIWPSPLLPGQGRPQPQAPHSRALAQLGGLSTAMSPSRVQVLPRARLCHNRPVTATPLFLSQGFCASGGSEATKASPAAVGLADKFFHKASCGAQAQPDLLCSKTPPGEEPQPPSSLLWYGPG